jgi:hypothetical protein
MFGESQRCARSMREPSRGSVHVAWFTRYTAARRAYWRSRMLGLSRPAPSSTSQRRSGASPHQKNLIPTVACDFHCHNRQLITGNIF